jgi:putative methyltransferase (TIGR04325 family)
MLSGNGTLKAFVRDWTPPGLIRLVQSGLDYVRPAPWEYIEKGWRTDIPVQGWNVPSITETQKRNWRAYAESLKGTGPLVVNHEDPYLNSGGLRDHNTLISCAYVLALAARQKQRLSVLDWGGGMGHYYLLSEAVLPEVQIEYYCQDLPLLCQAGREALPQAHFLERPDDCFSQQYDLILASSSIWYEENWRFLVDKLISVANPYLYVTRMIFVEQATSYVAMQRPWAVGYRTEYLCWILNRGEFVDYLSARTMDVVREFLICKGPHIHGAPEQGDYRGFLFRKRVAAPINHRPRNP